MSRVTESMTEITNAGSEAPNYLSEIIIWQTWADKELADPSFRIKKGFVDENDSRPQGKGGVRPTEIYAKTQNECLAAIESGKLKDGLVELALVNKATDRLVRLNRELLRINDERPQDFKDPGYEASWRRWDLYYESIKNERVFLVKMQNLGIIGTEQAEEINRQDSWFRRNGWGQSGLDQGYNTIDVKPVSAVKKVEPELIINEPQVNIATPSSPTPASEAKPVLPGPNATAIEIIKPAVAEVAAEESVPVAKAGYKNFRWVASLEVSSNTDTPYRMREDKYGSERSLKELSAILLEPANGSNWRQTGHLSVLNRLFSEYLLNQMMTDKDDYFGRRMVKDLNQQNVPVSIRWCFANRELLQDMIPVKEVKGQTPRPMEIAAKRYHILFNDVILALAHEKENTVPFNNANRRELKEISKNILDAVQRVKFIGDVPEDFRKWAEEPE